MNHEVTQLLNRSAETALAPYADTRVLLTGATGFIGSWTWRLLSELGADVVATGRSQKKLDDLAARWGLAGERRVLDLTRPADVAHLIEEARPLVIINAAGYGVAPQESDPALNARINAELPSQLAALATKTEWRGQQLIHIGSAFEYGSVEGEVTEESAAKPASPYAEMKLEGTRRLSEVVSQRGVKAVTVRVCTIYGPGEHAHRLLPSLLRAGAARQPLDLTPGEQERDFTYVRDIAEGLLRIGLLEQAPSVLNLATGHSARVREFSTVAYTTAGGDAKDLNFGALQYRANEVWQGPVRTDRLFGLLHWVPPTTLEEGIRETYDWLVREGELNK